MRVLLLSAGFGSRLRPLTDTIPKCLVPIKGKPLLQIWLERLTSFGLGPFLINTHHLADQVKSFISESRFLEQITLSHEEILRGTAGTFMDNLDFFQGKDGMVIHADNYCLADFSEFLNTHQARPSGCLMTMMTFRTDSPESCGILELDERGVAVAIHEKIRNPPGNLANGAIYIISAEMQNQLTKCCKTLADFSTDILPEFMGSIYTYETRNTFMDIGTPQNYRCANLD